LDFVWRKKDAIKMRLFVGVYLPKEVKEELFGIQKRIKGNLAKIKWVSKKNLHLTLKFLGEVKDKDVKEISDRLRRVEFEPFEVGLSNRIGVFPNWASVRVLWVGLSPKEKVIKLQQKVDSELLDLFKFDQRFNPHLTLGRVKFIKRKKRFIEVLKEISVKRVLFRVDKFYLIRSHLNKDGSVYEILESFECKDNI
jgi:2'-5' RNA ligase